jgi:hypothetical protein
MQTIMIIDPCGCVWRGNPRDGYDLTTCVVHWLCDMFDAGQQPPLSPERQGTPRRQSTEGTRERRALRPGPARPLRPAVASPPVV